MMPWTRCFSARLLPSPRKRPESRPVLEVNPEHALLRRLAAEADAERFTALASLVLDQATLAEGSSLADPAAYVRGLNRLLVELLG